MDLCQVMYIICGDPVPSWWVRVVRLHSSGLKINVCSIFALGCVVLGKGRHKNKFNLCLCISDNVSGWAHHGCDWLPWVRPQETTPHQASGVPGQDLPAQTSHSLQWPQATAKDTPDIQVDACARVHEKEGREREREREREITVHVIPTHRVQYVQEVILPTPSLFEENLLSSLNSFILFNKSEIVRAIQVIKLKLMSTLSFPDHARLFPSTVLASSWSACKKKLGRPKDRASTVSW